VRRHRGRLRAGPADRRAGHRGTRVQLPVAHPGRDLGRHNTVYGNDLGIYTDDRIAVSRNNASRNRYIGILTDSDARGADVDHNTADAMITPGHGYGIYVNANHGNTYEENQASGNTPFDLYANNAAQNTYRDNRCGTAFPSKAQWDC
jgi:Periplasmic copper-binding protein (NosD)